MKPEELLDRNNFFTDIGKPKGGSSIYYDLPINPTTLQDIIEYRNMDGSVKGDIDVSGNKLGKLLDLGILSLVGDTCRTTNIGESNYSKHIIQPWSIWKDWELDPWNADIIKRVLRDKSTDSRVMDYEKIIHICTEKIRQLKLVEQHSIKDTDDR